MNLQNKKIPESVRMKNIIPSIVNMTKLNIVLVLQKSAIS